METRTEEQKKNILEWIRALRSGKYAQGSQTFRTIDNKFCCWGVACDLADSSKWKPDPIHDCYGFLFEGREATLHGLPTDSFALGRFGITRMGISHLVNMNDHGSSFLEIADYIEQNYL